MSGNSGGGSPQVQDNSLQLEMMREQKAKEEQDRQDALKAQQRTDFTNNLSNAVAGAKTTGQNYFSSRGLDPNNYSSLIDSIIGDAKLKVPDLDANPGQYFTSDIFSSGIDNYQNTQRAGFNTKVNSTFAPGFESSLIPNSADDSILNSIYDSQYGTALKQLDFNKSRGVLNDSGYSTALNDLNAQGQAGRSTLKSIGDSILGKDRQDLLNIKGDAGTAASSWNIGGATPDIQGYYSKAQDRANTDLSGLEGSIRSALGSTNLFDVPTALQKGGVAQGPINLTTNQSTDVAPFDPKKSTAKRGLGSAGVF